MPRRGGGGLWGGPRRKEGDKAKRCITPAVSGVPPQKGAKKQRGHITSAVAGKRWPEGLGQVVLSWPGGPSGEEGGFWGGLSRGGRAGLLLSRGGGGGEGVLDPKLGVPKMA